MKNMKRSVRRHHYERLKNNWYNRLKNTWYWAPEDINEEQLWLYACHHVATPAMCSTCLGHINPRKYEGITLQEQKNLLTYAEQMKEVN